MLPEKCRLKLEFMGEILGVFGQANIVLTRRVKDFILIRVACSLAK